MFAGVRIFDRFGTLRVDIGDRLMRHISDPLIIPPGGSGVLVSDAFLTGSPDFEATVFAADGASYWPGEGLLPPTVSFSGNTMTYSVPIGLPTQIIQPLVW